MVFPSPDPIWIVELFKFLCMFLIGAVLLVRWRRADVHFYTDIPFLFGVGMFFAGAAESIDFFFDSGLAADTLGLMEYTLLFRQFRITLTGFVLLLWLFASLRVWIPERKELVYGITVVYTIAFLAAAWLAPTMDFLQLMVLPFLAIASFTFILTFLLAWYWKRLPDVHGLLASVGAIVAFIGQMIKNPLLVVGLTWVSELIDLLGIAMIAASLYIKPGYAK
jgi:hypothetical protein